MHIYSAYTFFVCVHLCVCVCVYVVHNITLGGVFCSNKIVVGPFVVYFPTLTHTHAYCGDFSAQSVLRWRHWRALAATQRRVLCPCGTKLYITHACASDLCVLCVRECVAVAAVADVACAHPRVHIFAVRCMRCTSQFRWACLYAGPDASGDAAVVMLLS